MTSQAPPPPTSTPMLELYRSQASASLSKLQGRLATMRSPDLDGKLALDLGQAAATVRGAALIVGLEDIARLASAMDETLRAVGDRRMNADDTLLSLLMSGADALVRESGEDTLVARLRDVLTRSSARPGISIPVSPPRLTVITTDSSEKKKTDPSMLSLFRRESESCVATLSGGIVRLEAGGATDIELESLMRAAHSIKGAARIVGLEPGVHVAHSLEDCFVAAQNGQVSLGAADVDLLLRGVDLLADLAASCEDDADAWVIGNVPIVEKTVGELTALAQRRAGESLAPALSSIPIRPSIEPRPSRRPDSESNERFVRVAAQSIDRLMGLAGESRVEASRVVDLSTSLQMLKRHTGDLADLLDELARRAANGSDPELAILLEEAKLRALDCEKSASERVSAFDGYARRLDQLGDRLYREALKSRMRPLEDGLHGLPRLVRDLSRRLGKQVKLDIVGQATEVDRDVLENLDAPLSHLLRNSVDHGIEMPDVRRAAGKPESGTIRLEARHHAGMLTLTVSDDGRGVDPNALRKTIVKRGLLAEPLAASLGRAELMEFLFLPGFSTARRVTEVSGRGVGLDVVRSVVEKIGGIVRATSEPGKGMTFVLQLPVTRSVLRAVVVEIAGEPYAFPLLRTECVLRLDARRISTVEGKQCFELGGKNIGIIGAAQLLGLGESAPESEQLPIVVVSDRTHRFGLVVDRFLGEHDLVVRPLDARLGKVRDVSAAAVLADGRPALIMDVDDIVQSIEKLVQSRGLVAVGRSGQSRASMPVRIRKKVLVVDDSITVRETQRQLLQNDGYDVVVAVDGVDGWNSVRAATFDLVISDIDMPRMNGIDFVRAIKNDASLRSMPVVIVSYKDREEDRVRGLDAGADAYLTKSSFHDQTLLSTVHDLIGSANP